MSSFTKPLIVEVLDSERSGLGVFRVYEEFSFGNICVPKGFDTDLASVPWFARMFMSTAGKVAKPAVLHDYLLEIGDPRHAEIFDQALKVNNVPVVTRKLMVASVRFWSFWRKRKR